MWRIGDEVALTRSPIRATRHTVWTGLVGGEGATMTEENLNTPASPVIVGIDGSERDATCIAWGAGAAMRTGRPMVLVHALNLTAELVAPDLIGGSVPAMDGGTDTLLQAALAGTRARFPDVQVTGTSPTGSSDRELIAASEGAHLLVVGSRRVAGFERLILGRSALAVAMHAHCPVVILPEGSRTDAEGPVVVGVDGSPASQNALDRAFWIAHLRDTSVRIVTTWNVEVVDGMVVTTPGTDAWRSVENRYRSVVEKQLSLVPRDWSDIPHEVAVVRGSPAKVLTEESARSSLLVVGSRGRGGFRGMLLGSVTHKVLETATCPVMVVRH
ncbi:conserved hypothetical protein [Phycicoccus elongatus Lp2]|uniref:UspA domain-containing protein n=2 Tax=Phycicoccus elongatus TaxID=101689 RepID=N0E4C8_9MICO|nr:conserved hypothetical protein [Phycicoccus elongatus Lp2]